jgi:uncharacterized membrane protein YdbT with pleckstrin-like domain
MPRSTHDGAGWQLRAIEARRRSARRHAAAGLFISAFLGIAAGLCGAFELCPLAIVLTALAFGALVYATIAAIEA